MALKVSHDTRLLFTGDSITDCGRRDDPEQLGSGFVRNIRDCLAAADPASAPQIINTGISGNRITHLAFRWERDVIAHAPDIVSIMIGINDVWHGLGGRNEGVGIAMFNVTYGQMVESLRAARPEVKLVLCEPTVIGPPAPAEGNDLLGDYVAAVGNLAKKFCAVHVQSHRAFISAQAARPDIAWTSDGVHPTSAGHMLIATTWLKATGLL